MVSLKLGEEIIRKTKPHPASCLGSTIFWVGISILLLGIFRELTIIFDLIGLLLLGTGSVLIGVSYIRRVLGYTFHLTDQKIISDYSFLRKAHREISYEEIIDIMIEQGVFAKIFGYVDMWMYGYRKDWIVGRMRGVRLGDCHLIKNKAWKNKINKEK